jgi:hypothetical protein
MTLKHLLKTAILALFVTASVWAAGPSFAAGTLPLAMAQQIDVNGQPLANCQVNFYVAGTVATRRTPIPTSASHSRWAIRSPATRPAASRCSGWRTA